MSERHYDDLDVETSSEDKVLFPESGFTKGDVIDYYERAWQLMAPWLENRCLTIQRFPDGIDRDGFFQQHRTGYLPEFVGACTLSTASGDDEIEHIVVNNRAALAYLCNLGAITFHGWLSNVQDPNRPDRVVFDLDPSGDDLDAVVLAARRLRDALDGAGLVPFVMTTGSSGMHVIAPLNCARTFDEVRDFARSLASDVADSVPDRLTIEQRKSARKGRLYIDVMRNAYGQTSVLPYSLRVLPGAPCATPLRWDELERHDIDPRMFRMDNIWRRLGRIEDPFHDFAEHARRLPGTT